MFTDTHKFYVAPCNSQIALSVYTWVDKKVFKKIIMEICKAPTMRLKALNKHTHIMYIEMENVIKKKKY